MASPEELAFAGLVLSAVAGGFGFMVKWITGQFLQVVRENTRALQAIHDVVEYCRGKQ